MGKKRVAEKTTEETLREQEKQDQSRREAAKRGGGKFARTGRAYVHASYNNTLITLTNSKGDVLAASSAGELRFRGPKKATPFAATKVVEALAEKVRKTGLEEIEVFVSGIGAGRDSAVRALGSQGFNILRIKDITPIPHNGPVRRKARRV